MSDFLPVNQLDFNALRANLRTYLEGQDRFKDYDFDGSNISVLLDLLAYNTYQNAYYLNMIGNEMFLDTATLRDSVVSHAKELNYLPRSYTSASATVQVKVNVSNTAAFTETIPQNYRFTSTAGGNTYTFSTAEPYIVTRNANNEFITQVDVYEGFLLTERFVVNTSLTEQRFVLSNDRVDTDSIEVLVTPSVGSSNTTEYTFTTSIFGLGSNSTVYFLQAAEDSKYEIVFGDGVIGKKPQNGNLISVNYRISSGNTVNGISTFTPQSSVNGYTVTVQSVISPAAGGADSESISSIKYNATRFFQTQDRVVTKEDYKSLIIANFPEVKSISVYGGEEIPIAPQYGKVVISPVTQTGNPVTQNTADRILSFVKLRSPLSINPTLVDPDFLDIYISSTVRYNVNQTTLAANQIRTLVTNAIGTYNSNNLIDFNKTFRYSKLVSDINNAHPSIVSNETSTVIAKNIIPLLNENYSETINYGNEIRRDDYNISRPLTNDFTVYSSQITYNSRPAYFGEDGAGKLFVYELTGSGRNILKTDAGTVDYINGVINISNIIISDFVGAGVTFFTIPAKQDIRSLRNTVLRIDNSQTVITVEAIKE
jgi:hypothetical protein